MSWYKKAQQNINQGYRANGSKSYGTEGNGLYVAETINLASFFGSNIFVVTYKNPTHPLVVNEEPLPLLQEEYDIFAPISPTDSDWIKINKQAVINAGLSENNWNIETACISLTNLLKQEGYDMVRVKSGGERWDVILDTSLVFNVKPYRENHK